MTNGATSATVKPLIHISFQNRIRSPAPVFQCPKPVKAFWTCLSEEKRRPAKVSNYRFFLAIPISAKCKPMLSEIDDTRSSHLFRTANPLPNHQTLTSMDLLRTCPEECPTAFIHALHCPLWGPRNQQIMRKSKLLNVVTIYL